LPVFGFWFLVFGFWFLAACFLVFGRTPAAKNYHKTTKKNPTGLNLPKKKGRKSGEHFGAKIWRECVRTSSILIFSGLPPSLYPEHLRTHTSSPPAPFFLKFRLSPFLSQDAEDSTREREQRPLCELQQKRSS